MVYLDYASTTPVLDEIVDSYAKLLKTDFANSASIHSLGLKVNGYLEAARNQILNLLKSNNEQFIFTSGATESNNLAIKGFVYANKGKGKHLITSAIEHSSVLNVFKELEEQGFELTILPVNEQGFVSKETLEKAIRKDTILVSIMSVNNETGIIQLYKEYSRICRLNNIAFHSDITQALGKIELDFTCYDLASFSAHKIHGMKGSGGLLKKKKTRINPQILGGGQEYGLRSGTSNWPLDMILAKTVRLALERLNNSYSLARDLYLYLYNEIQKMDNIHINSLNDLNYQSPYIFNFSIPHRQSEVIIHALEEHGYYVSSTSACGSKKDNYSKVILQMSNNMDYANSAIRVSISKDVKKEELEGFINALKLVLNERN